MSAIPYTLWISWSHPQNTLSFHVNFVDIGDREFISTVDLFCPSKIPIWLFLNVANLFKYVAIKQFILSPYSSKYPNASIDIHIALFLTGVMSHWLNLHRFSQYSQYHITVITVEHTATLISSSPWISALVLPFDLWRIKQWPSTTKAASSSTNNVASSVCKANQSIAIWDLFLWWP